MPIGTLARMSAFVKLAKRLPGGQRESTGVNGVSGVIN